MGMTIWGTGMLELLLDDDGDGPAGYGIGGELGAVVLVPGRAMNRSPGDQWRGSFGARRPPARPGGWLIMEG